MLHVLVVTLPACIDVFPPCGVSALVLGGVSLELGHPAPGEQESGCLMLNII